MADIVLATGESTSGTVHSLEIQPLVGNRVNVAGFKWTIMGPNGKRHASVKLSRSDAERIAEYLLDALEEDK